METNKTEKNIYLKYMDKKKQREKILKYRAARRESYMVYTIIVLMAIGAFNLYSINMRLSSITPKLIGYSVTTSVSLVSFAIFLKIDYRNYNKESLRTFMVFFGLIFFSIMSLNIPIFPKVNGGKGWLTLIGGFRIQVTEVFKLAYIIIYAIYFSRIKDKNKNIKSNEDLDLKKTVIGSFVVYGVFSIVLVFAVKDLGTAIHYGMIMAFIVFMSDLSDTIISYIIALAVTFTTAFTTLYYFFGSGYKHERVISFVNGLIKSEYDQDKGYQVLQSVIGYGSGGMIGKGYGNGIQKYSYLPEIDTDFAIVTFAEELGIVGMILILFLYMMLFFQIADVAKSSKDYFGKYLAMGIAGYIMTQVIINISVTLGLLPVFGIPLPFISYGGSSMLTLMSSLGIIFNINRVNSEL